MGAVVYWDGMICCIFRVSLVRISAMSSCELFEVNREVVHTQHGGGKMISCCNGYKCDEYC
jgi:hypothetical protein